MSKENEEVWGYEIELKRLSATEITSLLLHKLESLKTPNPNDIAPWPALKPSNNFVMIANDFSTFPI